MKFFVVLFAALTVASADTSKWSQIRLKFGFSGVLENIDVFWTVNNTLTEALNSNWVKVDSVNELGLTTVCVSQEDVRVCPLYDANGFVAGMQLAIPPTDVEGKGIPYDFNNFPVYEKKTINGVEYWTSTYYVVNPATLRSGGRSSMANLGDGLWLKNGTSHTEVPTDEATIASTTPYTKQNCLPNMGTHYYFDTTKNLECSAFQPFFLLTKDGNMDGIGWQFFGKTKFVERDWYDSINRQAADTTVPNGPDCMGDWTAKYGVISVHMYFVNEPWTITCDQANDSAVPITGLKNILLKAMYTAADVAGKAKRILLGYN